jgi:hypothetical protein
MITAGHLNGAVTGKFRRREVVFNYLSEIKLIDIYKLFEMTEGRVRVGVFDLLLSRKRTLA